MDAYIFNISGLMSLCVPVEPGATVQGTLKLHKIKDSKAEKCHKGIIMHLDAKKIIVFEIKGGK